MNQSEEIKRYLAKIGKRGGEKSRRVLSRKDAQAMVRIREARRAFRKYYAQCFWFMRDDLEIGLEDIPEIVKGLRLHGGQRGIELAERLCL
jgi:hypothetical protein